MIEACAIVGDLHYDVARIVEGFEDDFSAGILPQSATVLGRFQSVVDGIADHVHERVMNMFEDGGVNFDAFSDHQHARKLSALPSGVTHTPSEAVKRRSHRDHADLHHQFL